MKDATLKQFAEMLLSLPEHVQARSISWIDISYVREEELKEMKQHLEGQEGHGVQLGN